MAFDEQAYLAAKSKALGTNAYNPTGHLAGEAWNTGLVSQAFENAGLTPEQHYLQYGQHENLGIDPYASGVAPKTPVNDLFQPNLVPSSSSSSGLPEAYRTSLLDSLMPELIKSFSDMPGKIDAWTEKNLASSRSASKNLLDGHMTSLLADLSKRGMMGGSGSTVSSDAIANLGSQIAKDQTAAELAISGQGAQQKFQLPGLLGNIASLGTSSASQQSDPLAPYQLYSQMLLGMM